ncbi:hypothetical protein EAI85_01710 [Enterococcus durans]|nr:hypothetical protein EAI85_01710 [Enterococcus durans]
MRHTAHAAYRTKFYPNLTPPTRFDEEPLFLSLNHIVSNLESIYFLTSFSSLWFKSLISNFNLLTLLYVFPYWLL